MKRILLATLACSYLMGSEPVVLDENFNAATKSDSIYSIQLISYDKSREKLAHKFFSNLSEEIKKDAEMHQNKDNIYIMYKSSSDKNDLSEELDKLKSAS